ncbi:MAG: PD-(D/E)XK nuclease family protein [Nitrospira sp.]|nr:PD-(D/E)XK nuclease family protein [Nitrospira sp.]
MRTYELDTYKELLANYKLLRCSLKNESIFTIGAFSHKENICSNILAYYFNPSNDHGLSDLFLRGLLNEIETYDGATDNISIDREVTTPKNKRIDIVIQTDTMVIGIENKLFHALNNDLEDYGEYIDKIASQKKCFKIVLSLRDEKVSHHFKCVTYWKLFAYIKKNIGNHLTTASQKWLGYLADFMSAIEAFRRGNMDITEKEQFLIDHHDEIADLINAASKWKNKISEYLTRLNEDLSNYDLNIYSKSTLYLDIAVKQGAVNQDIVALDLKYYPDGWQIELFGRNKIAKDSVKKIIKESPVGLYNRSTNKEGKYVLAKIPLQTDYSQLKSQYESCMNSVRQSLG